MNFSSSSFLLKRVLAKQIIKRLEVCKILTSVWKYEDIYTWSVVINSVGSASFIKSSMESLPMMASAWQ